MMLQRQRTKDCRILRGRIHVRAGAAIVEKNLGKLVVWKTADCCDETPAAAFKGEGFARPSVLQSRAKGAHDRPPRITRGGGIRFPSRAGSKQKSGHGPSAWIRSASRRSLAGGDLTREGVGGYSIIAFLSFVCRRGNERVWTWPLPGR